MACVTARLRVGPHLSCMLTTFVAAWDKSDGKSSRQAVTTDRGMSKDARHEAGRA